MMGSLKSWDMFEVFKLDSHNFEIVYWVVMVELLKRLESLVMLELNN